MKIIIAGSRSFNNYNLLKLECDKFLNEHNISNPEIISGTANGADKLGEQYAKQLNIKLTQFPANWNLYGKSAGYKRNLQMAEYADALIAFWDNNSKGTKHMIDIANKLNLITKIITY
jgi:hypothetical protein